MSSFVNDAVKQSKTNLINNLAIHIIMQLETEFIQPGKPADISTMICGAGHLFIAKQFNHESRFMFSDTAILELPEDVFLSDIASAVKRLWSRVEPSVKYEITHALAEHQAKSTSRLYVKDHLNSKHRPRVVIYDCANSHNELASFDLNNWAKLSVAYFQNLVYTRMRPVEDQEADRKAARLATKDIIQESLPKVQKVAAPDVD